MKESAENTVALDYTGTEELRVLQLATNYNSFLTDLVKKYLPKNKDCKALDFGSGIGTFTDRLKEDNGQPDCFEVDPSLVQMLKNKGYHVFTDQNLVPNNHFDFIYSLNVLEHIEEDQVELEKLYEKLKPGGRIFLYLPAFSILSSKFDEKVGHYRRYRKPELVGKLKKAGFQIEDVHYADSLGFLGALVFKLVSNTDTINEKQVVLYDKRLFPISKALDGLASSFIGKNVVAVARKP